MQWSGEANAGFTTGTPWLKVNPNYTSINAAEQMKDPESVWKERHNLMAYYRKGDKTLLVVGNYQRGAQEIVPPGRYQKVLLNNYGNVAEDNGKVRLYVSIYYYNLLKFTFYIASFKCMMGYFILWII